MKKINLQNVFASALLFVISFSAFAETTIYSIRVDGLACPYCAYGIEKKLNEIQGVKFIDVDFDKGVVIAEAHDKNLDETLLKKLFQDSGFTYRSKTETIK